MTVLTIRVQQPRQGHQSVLPRTLCGHAVQVMNYGWGQNFPWRKTRSRKNVKRAVKTVDIYTVVLNIRKTVHLCWHGYMRCTWCRGVRVPRIRLSHLRLLFQDLGTPRLHWRESKMSGSFTFRRYKPKQINDKRHWPSLLSDIVLFSSESSIASCFYITWYWKEKTKHQGREKKKKKRLFENLKLIINVFIYFCTYILYTFYKQESYFKTGHTTFYVPLNG